MADARLLEIERAALASATPEARARLRVELLRRGGEEAWQAWARLHLPLGSAPGDVLLVLAGAGKVHIASKTSAAPYTLCGQHPAGRLTGWGRPGESDCLVCARRWSRVVARGRAATFGARQATRNGLLPGECAAVGHEWGKWGPAVVRRVWKRARVDPTALVRICQRCHEVERKDLQQQMFEDGS